MSKGAARRVVRRTWAAVKTLRRAERKAAPPVAECATRVRPRMQVRARLGGICRRVLGGESVRWAVAGADRRLLVWPLATVMMGDIGEEIIEIALEPLPEEMPAEEPVEPATEPVPG